MLASAGALELAELVQFRIIADSSANLLAAARRTDDHLLALERNMARMRESMSRGYAEFSQADRQFHEIIADAGGNKLVQVYGDVTREAVLNLIQQTVLSAGDQTALMLQSIRHHRAVFAAIAEREGLLASRLARESLYSYYADHVNPADRAIMADLVRECGGKAADVTAPGRCRGIPAAAVLAIPLPGRGTAPPRWSCPAGHNGCPSEW
ncbi:FadR/GntR family transcriptional regulator [Streptomyces sp. NPDC059863]|uniref:FadR/GntR family transcriptional regulator n=1 Tax=unclassified Streptomyces TaxID=2593676 RepID=UPI003669F180